MTQILLLVQKAGVLDVTRPIYYKTGWAVRKADRITQRIKTASKTQGIAEHIIVSVPKSDYGLDYEQL